MEGTPAFDRPQMKALAVWVLPAPLLPTIRMCWLVSFFGVEAKGSQKTLLSFSVFLPNKTRNCSLCTAVAGWLKGFGDAGRGAPAGGPAGTGGGGVPGSGPEPSGS